MTGPGGGQASSKARASSQNMQHIFRWVLLFELPGGVYGFLLPPRYINTVSRQLDQFSAFVFNQRSLYILLLLVTLLTVSFMEDFS